MSGPRSTTMDLNISAAGDFRASGSLDLEPHSTRTEIAHELHDNVIQTLAAAELRLAAVMRAPDGHRDRDQLSGVAELLREGLADLRDLLDRLRPRDVEPGELSEAMAVVAQRFQCDSGIQARVLADSIDPTVCSATCRHILRIVQEGLNNVRRHSSARHVVVRLRDEPGVWRLSIDDDGRGFPFDGRWSLEAMDRERRGPVVIKERAHTLGAEMFVESHSGRGARVELVIPKPAHD